MGAPLGEGDAGVSACFGGRLRAAVDAFGPLCVGIDPHPGLLDAWTWVRNATGKIGHSLGAGVEENCRWKRQRSRLTDTVVNGKSNYSLMS